MHDILLHITPNLEAKIGQTPNCPPYFGWNAQIDPPADLWRYWELAPMALPFFKKHLCR